MVGKWRECISRQVKKVGTVKIGGAQNTYLSWREEWGTQRVIPRNVKPSVYSELAETKKLLGEAKQKSYQATAEFNELLSQGALEKYFLETSEKRLKEALARLVELRAENQELADRAFRAEEKLRLRLPQECSKSLRDNQRKMEAEIRELREDAIRQAKLIDELMKALKRAEEESLQWKNEAIVKGKELKRKERAWAKEVASLEEGKKQAEKIAVKAEKRAVRAEKRAERAEEEYRKKEEEMEYWKTKYEEGQRLMKERQQTEREREEEIAERVKEKVAGMQRELEAMGEAAKMHLS